MAIQKNFYLQAYGQDVVVPNAYIKVNNITGDKH
jgi:hypothetical protein